ncbi:hypothetical protein BJ322DRAFT_1030716 [Thelephora terrestris]|uniref:Uncharacterized protein n=1 Tax=Thelephora terrestris TaxID=56493 RepID=A0A9P6HQJ1_9AGAM|nr:hypothetical protein BJ322DRAFT_1030716 [Thelephora terrestris]
MLLHSLLLLSLAPHLISAQLQSNTSTTNGPLLLPSGGPNHGLDLGHVGSTIGGASAGAVAVIAIALAVVMLRWSRRRNCLYHNKELGQIVPSLRYRKRDFDVETASVASSEDVSFQLETCSTRQT